MDMYTSDRAQATKAKHPTSEPIEVPEWLHVERAVFWLYKRWPPAANDENDEKVGHMDLIISVIA